MARYIDADITDEEVCDRVQQISHNADVFMAVRKVLETMPTIEAEPIRHGRWTKNFEDTRGYTMSFACSNCGMDTATPYAMKKMDFEYCPNCGAKMDGKE